MLIMECKYLGSFTISENEIRERTWANGQRGTMCYEGIKSDEMYYSFLEMPNGMDEKKEAYILRFGLHGLPVAVGIVAAWIRGRPFVMTEDLFEKYAQKHKHYYIVKNRSNPDSTAKLLESEGYLACIEAERRNIHISYNVFDFVSEDEQRLLRALITNYLLYLYKKADRMDIYKEAELRVLQHLTNDTNELMPEGMKDWEFNAVCDRLEKEGCVRVAWIEGHRAEAVMLLDAGRMRLRELEIEARGAESELERLQKENEELKARLQPNDNPSDDEIVKELASCFYGVIKDTRAFLNQIKYVEDREKPAIAKQYLTQKKLSENSARRPLWTILKKYKLYSKTEDNWNKGIGKK